MKLVSFFLFVCHCSFIIYFLNFYFNLQYCIGFAIHQHESAAGIHVFPNLKPLPPPSPYHLTGSSQCTSPKHPVSCTEPRLEIRFLYDIIHVSTPFSQIIPPTPSPTESKRLFYTSVSLLLSRIQSYCYHLSKFRIYALVLRSRLSRVQGYPQDGRCRRMKKDRERDKERHGVTKLLR